ncbi:MAG: hypothetical protein AAFO83_01490 [Cyanobacteria bacterium J06607_13]
MGFLLSTPATAQASEVETTSTRFAAVKAVKPKAPSPARRSVPPPPPEDPPEPPPPPPENPPPPPVPHR